MKWIKKTLFGTLFLIVLLLIIGFFFEQISRSNSKKLISLGEFIDVDGHNLHYYKKGNNGPSIIFETGFDPSGHLQWHNIQQELSKSTTTISYDRAGILWSERGDNPKTGQNIVEELYQLLNKINAPKPYIIVGHSMGGMLLRSFISKYPNEVAGIVLIDSQTPNDQEYLSDELYTLTNQDIPSGLLKFANTFGLARLMFRGMFPDKEEYNYQKSIMPALLHKSVNGIFEEQAQMSFLKAEASKINTFGSIPLRIISANDSNRFDDIITNKNLKNEMINAWDRMQKDLLNFSTNSQQILVPNSGHYIHEDQPKIIIESINELISEIEIDTITNGNYDQIK